MSHTALPMLASKFFKNEHLSVSRLKTFEQCPRSFFYRYVEKNFDTADRGLAADFGKVLHAALEAVYEWIVLDEYAGPFPVGELVRFYQDAWQASTMTGIGLYQEGLDILRSYARMVSEVDHFRILATEQEFNIDVHGYKMNGYIDRVDRAGDYAIEIVDYKSNRLTFSREELENDLQMSAYGFAARTLFPWAREVSFAFHMLRHGSIQRVVRTADQIDDAARYIAALGLRTETAREWPAQINANCAYCDHRTKCAAYKEALETKEIGKILDPTNLPHVVAESQRIGKLAKMAYARKKELEDVILAKIKNDGEFATEDFNVRTFVRHETKYELNGVVNAFALLGISKKDVLDRVVSVGKGAVDKMVEEATKDMNASNAELFKAELESAGTRVPQSPMLTISAIKKVDPTLPQPAKRSRAKKA